MISSNMRFKPGGLEHGEENKSFLTCEFVFAVERTKAFVGLLPCHFV